jgi:hypothetical protein
LAAIGTIGAWTGSPGKAETIEVGCECQMWRDAHSDQKMGNKTWKMHTKMRENALST